MYRGAVLEPGGPAIGTALALRPAHSSAPSLGRRHVSRFYVWLRPGVGTARAAANACGLMAGHLPEILSPGSGSHLVRSASGYWMVFKDLRAASPGVERATSTSCKAIGWV